MSRKAPTDDRGLILMMLTVAAATLALLLAMPAAAEAPSCGAPLPPAPEVPTSAVRTVLTEKGLVGEFYAPPTPGKHPAILVLGGSEGGLAGSVPLARRLANEGYATFALAYFGAPGTPGQLDLIPMEYFRAALDWLEARPEVDGRRIGLIGASKGGEAVLEIASRFDDVRVVVAGAPSSVVWQSLNFGAVNSSWSAGGRPAPFVPYDMSRPFAGVLKLYVDSLATLPDHQDAIIPVERINGPVMLVAGEADQMWPSAAMSRQVADRLKAKGFRYDVALAIYPDAGHGAFGVPSTPDNPRARMLPCYGGTLDGNLAARVDGWPKVLTFLKAALKP